MGGYDSRFYTTCWTVIADSNTDDETRNRLIINDLLSRYWKPVCCYLRRKGHDNESAKDLTQGFFCEIVLGRELIKKANKRKGRFRTFLLTALDRYVISGELRTAILLDCWAATIMTGQNWQQVHA